MYLLCLSDKVFQIVAQIRKLVFISKINSIMKQNNDDGICLQISANQTLNGNTEIHVPFNLVAAWCLEAEALPPSHRFVVCLYSCTVHMMRRYDILFNLRKDRWIV